MNTTKSTKKSWVHEIDQQHGNEASVYIFDNSNTSAVKIIVRVLGTMERVQHIHSICSLSQTNKHINKSIAS